MEVGESVLTTRRLLPSGSNGNRTSSLPGTPQTMASTSAQTTTKRELVARITEQINRSQDEKYQAAQEQVGTDLARGGERARKAKAKLERLKGARMTKVLVKEVLETFLDEVVGELALGHRLEFREFGVFEVRQRLARKAQNPRTLEAVDVPAKRVVKFKPGRSMRALVCDNPAPLDHSDGAGDLGLDHSVSTVSKAGSSSGEEAGQSATRPDPSSDPGPGSKAPPTPPKPKNPSSPF